MFPGWFDHAQMERNDTPMVGWMGNDRPEDRQIDTISILHSY